MPDPISNTETSSDTEPSAPPFRFLAVGPWSGLSTEEILAEINTECPLDTR